MFNGNVKPNLHLDDKRCTPQASASVSTPERSPVNKASAMTKTPSGSIGVNECNSSVFHGGSWRARKKVESHKAFEGKGGGSETVETRL